ncbi:hypothetical protein FN846DRAFT_903912 [Sphaerosporella brunnea]|uniref:Etoposide-induced protein 2.4-domain-containing protein n=1 Tax=Sphaerosporella brunnea TaxID=1250544 RepID=A0A5J5F6V5_9PEZI|nr:hypothetical protein FN846DRAFT_903912 [Sphaerosporella brunnea]
MPLKDTVVETVKAEAAGVSALTKQAIASGTYLYPFKGLIYFFTHRQLWKPLISRLLPLLSLSVGVVVPMFLFTFVFQLRVVRSALTRLVLAYFRYMPQAFFLQFVNGPLAWVSTIALVLSESAAIISALSKNFLIEDALVDTFDQVLVSENMTDLVKNGRELKTGSSLGRLIKKPFAIFSPQAVIRYFLYLPLNFIPVVGTAVFLVVQGREQGPSYHNRYFQLKSYTKAQKEAFIERNNPAYIAFGTAATLLQLVPGLSILFLYTNTVGAALWAVDLERKGLAGPGEDKTGNELSGGAAKKKEL